MSMSEAEMDGKVAELQKWTELQSNIPDNIERRLLLRYLKACNFDIEDAKELLKYSLEMRCKNQHIFTNRDIHSPEIQEVMKISEIVPMPKTTPENYKVSILRLVDCNSDKFTFDNVIKAFFMFSDLRLVSDDPNPELADGEVPIFDMKGITMWHSFKVNLSTLKLYFKYVQEAHPVRVRQCHVINCTSLITRIMALIKPLLKPEVAARLQFHSSDYDTLYQYVPRYCLPYEYGGEAGSMQDMKEFWMQKAYEKRDYINNDANWIAAKCDDRNNNNYYN